VNRAGRDWPRRLVTLASRRLRPERRDWAQAMLAELHHVQGRGARWRFALGCARVALVPPRVEPPPRLAVRAAVLVGAVGMGLGIYSVSPAMHVFAVLFAAMLAGCVWTALRRSRETASRPGPGRMLRAVLLLGVAGCVGVVLYGVVRYPAAAGEPWDPVLLFLSVILATMLTSYTWMALIPPRAATAHILVVRRYGLAGGVVVGGLLIAGGAAATLGFGEALAGWSWLAAAVAAVAACAMAARSSGDARAGLAAGFWIGMVAALILFVGGMWGTYAAAGAGRLSPTDAYTLRAFAESGLPDLTSYVVGDNLGGSITMLLWIPLLSVAIGAGSGELGVRPARRPRGWVQGGRTRGGPP
jgi:hypothetical protein